MLTLELRYKNALLHIDKLRHENQQLRRRIKTNSRHSRRVQDAYEDALRLAHLRVGGLPTSRRFAADYGISQNKWQNAIALLRLARMHNGVRWLQRDLVTIESALRNALATAIAVPEAFTARLNKHGRD